MKGKAIRFLTAAVTVGLFVALSHVAAAHGAVTLEVLNPRGEIAPLPIAAPAPRLATLAGKRVGIYWNNKAGGDYFWDVVEAELKVEGPDDEDRPVRRPLRPGRREGRGHGKGGGCVPLRRGRLRLLHMGRRGRFRQDRQDSESPWFL